MAQDVDPSGVQIVQPDSPADVSAGRGNGFLSLAGALADGAPELHDALGAYAEFGQKREAAKAQAAAFANTGEAFGDAVREGKIEATQNPWFMKAYNLDAAVIRGKSDMAALLDSSQTWPERTDPQKFQARFGQEMGALAQKYSGGHPEVLQGFETAAAPIYQAALAENTQYNIDRIHTERTENLTALATDALGQTAAKNGGALTAETAGQALAPVLQQAIATGGTQTQARALALAAVVNHAAQTGNGEEMRSLLSTDIPGLGRLSDTVDAQGSPIGLQALKDSYFIVRDQGAAAKADAAKVTSVAHQVVSTMEAQYGLQAGRQIDTNNAAIMDIIQKAGVTDPGLATRIALEAKRVAAEAFEGATKLHNAMVAFDGTDPAATQRLLGFHAYAAANGLTKDLVPMLSREVASGEMSLTMADSIITEASSTSRTKFSEGMANNRENASLEADARRAARDALTNIKQVREQLVAAAVYAGENLTTFNAKGQQLFHKGDPTQPVITVDPYLSGTAGKARLAALDERIKGAMSVVQLSRPNDYAAIQQAGRDELARFFNERAAARAKVNGAASGALSATSKQ